MPNRKPPCNVFNFFFFPIYSAALEKFCYPVLDELPASCRSPPKVQFQVESLQQLLNCYIQNGVPMCMYVDKLFYELESFVMDISKQFTIQETEVCL